MLGRALDSLIHLVGGFAGGKSVEESDESTFERMCAPGGKNAGPPREPGRYGKNHSYRYRADRGIEWAESRLVLVPRLVRRRDTRRPRREQGSIRAAA